MKPELSYFEVVKLEPPSLASGHITPSIVCTDSKIMWLLTLKTRRWRTFLPTSFNSSLCGIVRGECGSSTNSSKSLAELPWIWSFSWDLMEGKPDLTDKQGHKQEHNKTVTSMNTHISLPVGPEDPIEDVKGVTKNPAIQSGDQECNDHEPLCKRIVLCCACVNATHFSVKHLYDTWCLQNNNHNSLALTSCTQLHF